MPEYVDFRPACKIKVRAVRKEVKTGLRQFGAAFAFKANDEFGVKAVQVAHVACGIVFLCFG